MRLDLRALWIDDQPRHVASFREGIQRKLDPLGFALDVVQARSLDEVNQAAGSHVHDDNIDLVLVDHDLGVAGRGEEALARVRQRFPFKDVIFYSADDRQKLRRIAFEAELDGIYFSTRLSLVDDTFNLIETLLRKVMDIDHMRGVVMGATSDIDFLIERSLLAAYGRLAEEERASFRDSLLGSLRDKLDRWHAELQRAATTEKVEALLALHHICTAADRLGLLFDVLSQWDTGGSGHLEKVRQYRDEVVPRRNKLAHLRLRMEGDRAEVVGAPDVKTEAMEILRCELLDHRSHFLDIAVLVDAPLD